MIHFLTFYPNFIHKRKCIIKVFKFIFTNQKFDESLKHKQEVCVIHKSDLLSEELLSQITEHLRSVFFHYRERPPRDGEPLWVSSATQQGLGDLLKTLDEIFSKSTPIKLETLRRKGVVLPDGTRTELA